MSDNKFPSNVSRTEWIAFLAPRFFSPIPHSTRLSFSDCSLNKPIVSIGSVLQFEVTSTCCFSNFSPKLICPTCFLDRKRDGDFFDVLFGFLCHKFPSMNSDDHSHVCESAVTTGVLAIWQTIPAVAGADEHALG